MKVKLHDKEGVFTLSELKRNLCGDYFKRYFENQAREGPVVLPQISSGINKVVDTMERWCINTSDSFELKGLVIHSFNVSEYFRKLFYDKFDIIKLRKDLDIKDIPSAPIIIVYNPSENVILLIRTSGKEGLREQIEFCSHDLKMFMLLFGDDVKSSRTKVISLLASNETANETLICEDCKNCIVPFETLESNELFQNWFHNHAENFNVDADNIGESIIKAASSKLIGCLAAAPYFDNLPTFTEVPNEQMKHLLILLTPAQKKILYSSDKHLIIQGPYGSGKSILARKKLEMLLDELKESGKNGTVHFICHDSKSALLSEIGSSPNVMVYGNKRGDKLSDIVKDILKTANNENLNLIVDEYDGENLDKVEAETLNHIFEEKFHDAIVFLVPQSMEKERNIVIKDKSGKEEKNKFDLLKKFKQVDLNLVMRNSIEISNLIWVTQNFLKEQETMYQHPRQADVSGCSTNQNESVNALELSSSSKTKEMIQIKPTKFGQKEAMHVNSPEQETIGELCLSKVVVDIKKSGEKISIRGTNSSDVKNQEECVVRNFGLDEAFGFAGIPIATKGDADRIVNTFKYKASEGIGHNISSCYPKLLEVDYDSSENHSFEKFLVLTVTFKTLKIKKSNSNNKHVVLHFDTSSDEIPKLFTPVMEYLKISHRVTNNYEGFKYNKSKSILVCSFRLLRGLEHSNVTIVIDRDIYSVQHYLVEAMARCSNKLNIVVLEKSDATSKIISQWDYGLNGQKLIDQWKVKIITGGGKEVDIDEKLKLIKISSYPKNHDEMRKIFDQHAKQNLAWNVALVAQEIIWKR